MRRVGYILAALLALGGAVRADQGWSDNQDGMNFACYDVGSFSANNLVSGGPTCATATTGEINICSDPANSFFGVAGGSTAVPAPISCPTPGTFAGNVGGTLGCTSTIPATSAPLAAGAVGFGSAGNLLTGDATNFHWDGTNFRLGLREAAPAYQLHLVDESGASDRGITSQSSFASTTGMASRMLKSRGSFASPATVVSGDYLGRYEFAPYTPSGGFVTTAVVGAQASGTITGALAPTRLYLAAASGGVSSDPFGSTNVGLYLTSNNSGTPPLVTIPSLNQGFSSAIATVNNGGGLSTSPNLAFSSGMFRVGAQSGTAGGPTVGTFLASVQGASGTPPPILAIIGLDTSTSPHLHFYGPWNGALTYMDQTYVAPGSAEATKYGFSNAFVFDALQQRGAPSLTDAVPTVFWGISALGGTQFPAFGLDGYGASQWADSSAPISSSGYSRVRSNGGHLQYSENGGGWTNFDSASGTVTSVTGTAQRISVVNPTTTPVVDTIGGYYSGAVSGGNEDLGTTLTNGLVCDTTTAGVAVLSTCAAGTDYQAPMSAADGTVVFPTATTIRRAAIAGDATIAAGSNVSKVVALTDGGAVSHPIGSMTNSQCMALDGSGNVITQACASGSGTVTSVTGTAGQILCTPTSPNPVCSLIAAGSAGSCTNCSVTFDALGRETAQSSGTAPVTSVGVTAPITTTGGTTPTIGISLPANQVAVGTGTNIGGTNDFTFDDSAGVASVTKSVNGTVAFHVSNPNVGASTVAAIQVSQSATLNTAPFANMSMTGSGTATPGSLFFGFVPSSSTQTIEFINTGSGAGNAINFSTNAGNNLKLDENGLVSFPLGGLHPTAVVSPGTPAAGTSVIYEDSTSKNLAIKNDAGTVNHGIQTATCGANTFASATTDAGAVTCTQPAFSNLSGSATCAQLPALTGDATSTAGTCGTTVVEIHESGGLGIPIGACTTDGQAFVKLAGQMTCRLPAGDLSNDYSAPTVIAIEADGAMKGDLLATSIATPAAPSAGHIKIYGNTTADNAMMERSNGNVTHMMQTAACGAGQFFSGSADDGTFTCSSTGIPSYTLNYNYLDLSIIGGFGGLWAIAGPVGMSNTDGNAYEYSARVVATKVRISGYVSLYTLSAVGLTSLQFQVTRNGSNVTGAFINPTATGVFDSGLISVSSGAATDTWGMQPAGSNTGGGVITLTVTVTLYQ